MLFISDGSCPFIFEHGRQECGYPGVTEDDCLTEGCCWDEHAQRTFVRCYHRGSYYICPVIRTKICIYKISEQWVESYYL